ncbi:DUF1499 domain-containing protein [Oricola sp.]|uniref:DUF1499 domain-containing protein n=1 Tax=Oricola sp. TaxID=1979950 RepID=UPI0025CEA564|nr:DUF1499 domain-containing protein [Oricola sp.]MCI5073647.1 DUF1499 domain-containing protein [Oricola sp.]
MSAGWSLRFAIFAPVLALISLLAHYQGWVDTPTFFNLVASAVTIALVGLVLIIMALHSLWMRGTMGGRRAILALFLTAFTLAPFVLAGVGWVLRPHQADVSTDLIDPPLLEAEVRVTDDNPAAIVASRMRDGYPHLAGRRFKAPPEAIEETILTAAANQGWTLASRRGRIGADDELIFEFTYTIPVLAIPGSVVLRLTDEGDTSFIDMRARTDFVSHDLGWNARLIARYLDTLDFQLIGIVEA